MQKKTNIIYSFPQNTLQHIYYEFIAKFFKHEYTSINRSTENIRNGIIRKRNYSILFRPRRQAMDSITFM